MLTSGQGQEQLWAGRDSVALGESATFRGAVPCVLICFLCPLPQTLCSL